MAEILDLLAARDPLPPVRIPNGVAEDGTPKFKVVAVRESDGFLEQLLEDAAREHSSEKFALAWRYLMPDLTPEDASFLVTQDYARILAHARQNVVKTMELVEANRKNGLGGIAASANAIPPSSPTTASSTPSPASPAPSGATGPSSAESPTGRRSSRSTRSRKSSGSTDSSPTLTP